MKNTSKTTEEKTYTTSEVGSMLERIDDSVKILAEGHLNVVETQKNIIKTLDGMLETQVDMGNRLGRVEAKIDILQDDMVEVKFELRRKVDADELEKLEKRVVRLEKLSA